jgi:hypothetical protein
MPYRQVLAGIAMSASDKKQLNDEFDRLYADLAALRAAIVGITAKLDLDGGVTDTNYASLHNPAALTFKPL